MSKPKIAIFDRAGLTPVLINPDHVVHLIPLTNGKTLITLSTGKEVEVVATPDAVLMTLGFELADGRAPGGAGQP